MTNPHAGFVIAAYAVGVALIVLEVLLVARRAARARAHAARPLAHDDHDDPV